MNEQASPKKEYDFSNKDPSAALTPDELEHFEEGMRLKNTGIPANQMNFAAAARATVKEFDTILAGK